MSDKVQLLIKKLAPEAQMPTIANEGDAGLDIYALDDGHWHDTFIEYKTGLALGIPEGYHVHLYPRSSISKYDLVLANGVGTIDQSYTGEVLVRFKYIPRIKKYTIFGEPKIDIAPPLIYKENDKIAQLIICKTHHAELKEVKTLPKTSRGSKGFGSSGN